MAHRLDDAPENYTQYYYDAAGNKLRMYTGLSSPLTINSLDSIAPGSDTTYITTKYEYDRFGKMTKKTDNTQPTGKENNYTYDIGGNLLQETDRDGNVINYTYDGLGRTLSRNVMTPDGTGNAAYSYTYTEVQYVEVDDASIFESLDKMNQWLIDYRDPNDPDLRLLDPDNPYRDSVYVKGDFTASHEGALNLLDRYNKELPDVLSGKLKTGDFGVPNSHYKLGTNNCSQVTMALFMKGTLPQNGTNVGTYMALNNYGVSPIPNWNMINMQTIFYNKATNLTGFEAAMRTQQNKYEGKSSFIQWWYSGLRDNIDTIR